MPRTRIKICCLQSASEAQLAIAAGADALGLVGTMPSGPGPIADELIAAIAAGVPPPVATFLLTSETEAEAIIAHARRCRTNTLQLVDRVEPADYRRLRAALAGHQAGAGGPCRRREAVAEARRRRGPRRRAAARLRSAARGDQGPRRHRPDPRLGAQPRDRRSGRAARCSSLAACAPTMSRWRSRRCAPSASTSAPACAAPTTRLDPAKLQPFVAAVAAAS